MVIGVVHGTPKPAKTGWLLDRIPFGIPGPP